MCATQILHSKRRLMKFEELPDATRCTKCAALFYHGNSKGSTFGASCKYPFQVCLHAHAWLSTWRLCVLPFNTLKRFLKYSTFLIRKINCAVHLPLIIHGSCRCAITFLVITYLLYIQMHHPGHTSRLGSSWQPCFV